MITQYVKQLFINYNLSNLFRITPFKTQLNKTLYRRRRKNQEDNSTTNYIDQKYI